MVAKTLVAVMTIFIEAGGNDAQQAEFIAPNVGLQLASNGVEVHIG
jgi:hypothetical protein